MSIPVVIPTNWVNWDITQCKIENVLVKIEREGVLSFTEREFYQSYNVCTKEVISEYSIPSLTVIPFLLLFVVLIFFWIKYSN